MMFFILMVCAAEIQPLISETGIYAPVSQQEAVVDPDGAIYLLDKDEVKILRFSPDGEKIGEFGRKGEGPGEMGFPGEMIFSNGKLYVKDFHRRGIHIFSKTGHFEKFIKLTKPFSDMVKVSNGWIIGDWMASMPGQESKKDRLLWVDESLENEKVIFEWDKKGPGKGIAFQITDGKAPKVPFNPASGSYHMAVNASGSKVYVSVPGSFKICIFDVVTGENIQTIEELLQPMPFNKDWGKKQIEELNNNQTGNFKLEFVADFPEMFPFVRGIGFAPEGHFYVTRWQPLEDKQSAVLFFDQNGKRVKGALGADALDRILGYHSGQAFFTIYDEDDESKIAKCPLADLNSWVSKLPILEEGGFKLEVTTD